jgi:Mrp family chromosome partitioning ATPase
MTTTLIGRLFAACKKLDGREFGWEDADSLPVQSRRFLLQYGWKQWQADAHAGTKRENFPTGSAGTDAWKEKVLQDIEERMEVITTGVGLPGEPKPNVAAELARALARIAELEAQATATVESHKKKAA